MLSRIERRSPALAHHAEQLKVLRRLCREGRLFDVQAWIESGQPLQAEPGQLGKMRSVPTALEIAVKTGQNSLVQVLLSSGYRLDLEPRSPFNLAMQARRWDLVDLLFQWGADPAKAEICDVLDTYDSRIYERFWDAGVDLAQRHELGATLGVHASNKPLFGFVKRHLKEEPSYRKELNLALGMHVKDGNEKGVLLCLWAGADPHAPAPTLDTIHLFDEESEHDDEAFLGWTAIEQAVEAGNLEILKRLGPNPSKDDFDDLYRAASSSHVVEFLMGFQPPKNLLSVVRYQVQMMDSPIPWGGRGTYGFEALFRCGLRLESAKMEEVGELRRALLKVKDRELEAVLKVLRRPKNCVPELYQDLTRTPAIQRRMIEIGLIPKPAGFQERRRRPKRKRRRRSASQ